MRGELTTLNELDEIPVRGDVISDNLLDVVCWPQTPKEKKSSPFKKVYSFYCLVLYRSFKKSHLEAIFKVKNKEYKTSFINDI